jgi:MoaA/NifB/PqqE/SkfB family radical SAM enzyme
MQATEARQSYGLRRGAEEFPLMVVLSIIYPCNFGCPNCPYTDANSEIRQFYHQRGGDLFPEPLWNRIAGECGEYGAWMRCTGGGEPMLHPRMVDMIEFAKAGGARVWLNTNGSMFGPTDVLRNKLRRVIAAGTDLIEFSMDAGDAETYAQVRPPHRGGPPRDPEKWWRNAVDNVRASLALRKELTAPTRVVVSIIRQEQIEGKLDAAIDFWIKEVGVDEVITRKFLTWDDNTHIDSGHALDPHLLPIDDHREDGTVRLAVRAAECRYAGADCALAGRTSLSARPSSFPTPMTCRSRKSGRGERFNWYRRLHLEGRGAEAFPCRGCSAWFAGIRDWDHGWLKVLKTSGDHLKEVMRKDLGVEVKIYEPESQS